MEAKRLWVAVLALCAAASGCSQPVAKVSAADVAACEANNIAPGPQRPTEQEWDAVVLCVQSVRMGMSP